MDFAYDARTEQLSGRLLEFMDSHVYPAERVFADQVAQAAAAGRIWQRPAVIDELKAQARSRGLWNLFLTVRAPGRYHRAQRRDRARGTQLRRAGHRQHGIACRVRNAGADRTLAPPAA